MAPHPRRSALFMPASNPRALAKARTLACDVVILDLEDAVAPDQKPAAREAALAAAAQGFGARECVIRVNGLDTEWGAADARAATAARPDAVLFPKVGGAGDLLAARRLLGDGGPPIWAMIETCAGVLALPDIAAAARDTGTTVFIAGTNDLAKDMRCRPGTDRQPLIPALAAIVTAARAVGAEPLDGVCNAIDDPDRLARECEQGAALGFAGKTLIHPAQIDAASTAFAPTAEEVAWAQAVTTAFADPANVGLGAIRVAGSMVERLHLADAERILRSASI